MSEVGKWSYRCDGDLFQGGFPTRGDAIAQAIEDCETNTFETGQCMAPTPPETFIDAELVLDHILCQDDYRGDVADLALDCTKEDREVLTDMLQEAFRRWMYKRGISLGFWLIDPATIQQHEVTEH